MQPSFSPRIQDLIGRMLVLDPEQRITISQIKEHPAFRYGLPEQYVFPTPLPLDCGERRIDPSTISPEIVDLLHKIGYNDEEELQHDFETEERTMAKIFYMMLTSRVSLNEIRWDLSIDENPEYQQEFPHNDDKILVPPNQQAFTLGQEEDPFHTHEIINPQSLEMGTSFAAQTEWEVPADSSILQIHLVSCPGCPIIQAITAMQVLVRQFNMQWFHPDEYTIIARDEANGLYVIIIANIAPDGDGTTLELQLCHGTIESFTTLSQAADAIVSSMLNPVL